MCLIPSCSPLSEIRRTERALIWSLILGSSSVATVHHSSQKQIFGAVCPPDMILLRRRTDAGPQLQVVIILRVRHPCPYTIYSRAATSRRTLSANAPTASTSCSLLPRRRTFTVPATTSRSPMMSRYGIFCRAFSRIFFCMLFCESSTSTRKPFSERSCCTLRA